MKLLKRLILEDNGVTSIEYAFIAVLISITIIGASQAIGGTLSGIFNTVAGAMALP